MTVSMDKEEIVGKGNCRNMPDVSDPPAVNQHLPDN